MKVAVISPHVDDAVWSVAEHMLSRPTDQFTIVCPCGAVPQVDPDRTKYMRLLSEHEVVVQRAGWKSILGPFVDDGVVERGGVGPMPSTGNQPALVHWLKGVLQEEVAPGVVRDLFHEWWVPHGIRHPDHLNVRDAVETIDRPKAQWFVYEELPYRVLSPLARVPERRYELRGMGPAGAQLEAKRGLCHMYSSQFGETEERCLFVPERLWGPE